MAEPFADDDEEDVEPTNTESGVSQSQAPSHFGEAIAELRQRAATLSEQKHRGVSAHGPCLLRKLEEIEQEVLGQAMDGGMLPRLSKLEDAVGADSDVSLGVRARVLQLERVVNGDNQDRAVCSSALRSSGARSAPSLEAAANGRYSPSCSPAARIEKATLASSVSTSLDVVLSRRRETPDDHNMARSVRETDPEMSELVPVPIPRQSARSGRRNSSLSGSTDPDMPELLFVENSRRHVISESDSASDDGEDVPVSVRTWGALEAFPGFVVEREEPHVDDLSLEEGDAERQMRIAEGILECFDPSRYYPENQDLVDAVLCLARAARDACGITRVAAIETLLRIYQVADDNWLLSPVIAALTPDEEESPQSTAWALSERMAVRMTELLMLRQSWPEGIDRNLLDRLCHTIADTHPAAAIDSLFSLVPRSPVDADFVDLSWILLPIVPDLTPKFEMLDRIIALQNFSTDSKDQVSIKKGQTGCVREVDKDGDMSILFDGIYQKRQWVFKRHCFRVAAIGKTTLNSARAKESQVYEGTEFPKGDEEGCDLRVQRRQILEQDGNTVVIEAQDAFLHGEIYPDGAIYGTVHPDLDGAEEPSSTFELRPVAAQEVSMHDRWPRTSLDRASVDVEVLAREARELLARAQCAMIVACDDFSLDESSRSAGARNVLDKLTSAVSVKTPTSETIAAKASALDVSHKLEALKALKKMDARTTE